MKRKGFALVDILVVVAIIAVLGAILSPVFVNAQDKARQITCMNNEKRIGMGLFMYAQDNNNIMPRSYGWEQNPPNDPRALSTSRYGQFTNGIGLLVVTKFVDVTKDTAGRAIPPDCFYCPNLPRPTSSTWYAGYSYSNRTTVEGDPRSAIGSKWAIMLEWQQVIWSAEGHYGMTNVLFGDGHAEAKRLRTWKDVYPWMSDSPQWICQPGNFDNN